MQSFNDKFLLLKLCPYDETIFFDADCLAFGDLNEYWEFFKGATDFSIIGINCDLNDNNGAWYNLDGIGKYGGLIEYKCRVHAGVIFVRKAPSLDKMYKDCMELFSNFNSLYFHTCPSSVDECIFGVAMPMNHMRATRKKPSLIAYLPGLTKIKANIYRQKIEHASDWYDYTKKGLLLHWGTHQTKQPLYLFNIDCLNYLLENKRSFLGTLMYKYELKLNRIP